jgi:hypothetical protein
MADHTLQKNDVPINQDINIKFDDISILKEFKPGKGKEKIYITPYFLTAEFTEDIDLMIITGKMFFRDIMKLFEYTPFLGSEVIEFAVVSGQTRHSFKFLVANYEIIPKGGQSYEDMIELDLVSVNYRKYVEQHSTYFSKTKYGTLSNFIKEYGSKILGDSVTVTSSKFEKDMQDSFAFPYMDFKELVGYINHYIISQDGNNQYYYFRTLLSSSNNICYYYSLSDMLKQKAFTIFQHVHDESKIKQSLNLFSKPKLLTPNLTGTIRHKGVGSTNRWFDFKNKIMDELTNDVSTVMTNEWSVGDYFLFDNEFLSVKDHNEINATKDYSGYTSVLKNTIDNCFGMDIQIIGTLERMCGTIVHLKFDPDEIGKTVGFNEALTGNYLIKSIKHEFFPSQYMQHIRLVKNGINIQSTTQQIAFLNKNNSFEKLVTRG